MIGESPVNIECKVKKIEKLGSHHMFLAEVVAVHADEAYMDKNNKFQLNQSKLMENIWALAKSWARSDTA